MTDRLKQLRKKQRFSQMWLSQQLQCDQSMYSKYERGEREIPLRLIVKLADLYEVSIDYLVGRTEQP